MLRACVALAAALLACAAPERPSILLFVMDTTRADAVSAQGAPAGATPRLDALAAGGLRYRNAWANAPWTLPSHATLFTGLLPHQHGVGWQAPRAPDELVTLAERLRGAGYATFGISENPWVGESLNLAQGFERFASLVPARPDDLQTTLRGWLEARARDRSRPLFLFVNVLDPHWPYALRDSNRFLPAALAAQAPQVSQWPPEHFCASAADSTAMAVMRGLYQGDVAAADAKLGQVLELLAGEPRLLTLVTADHGEHFGEQALASHQFSLREPVLRVPLVLHGLPGVAPALIDAPVSLTDVAPTLLAAAGVELPAGLAGRPLPARDAVAGAARVVIAEQGGLDGPPRAGEPQLARLGRAQSEALRARCAPEARVWGEMQAVIHHPWKLIAYERFPAELYDLRADPGEQRDLAPACPELAAWLRAVLEARLRASDTDLDRQVPAPGCYAGRAEEVAWGTGG